MQPLDGADLPGYRQVAEHAWTDDHGDVISLHFFDLPPDIPAPLEEPVPLRQALAHVTAGAGGGLIEADVVQVAGLPALRQVLKVPLPDRPSGLAFLGSYTLPRAACSAVVKVQAFEAGPTGMREALVLAELGPEQYFLAHPYAPGLRGGLPFHRADAPEYDARFPGHPLTRVRTALAHLSGTLRADPDFAQLPPFTGPAGRRTRLPGWVSKRTRRDR
ncbi:hypothetical protein ACFWVC_12960 [Streptomyces sp. NPDC058691]|uniref:hypothetical protein n=1 Tax=Streptomyces sp. NPDC058691 TaxID=3346601 RepID=UPI0036687EAE